MNDRFLLGKKGPSMDLGRRHKLTDLIYSVWGYSMSLVTGHCVENKHCEGSPLLIFFTLLWTFFVAYSSYASSMNERDHSFIKISIICAQVYSFFHMPEETKAKGFVTIFSFYSSVFVSFTPPLKKKKKKNWKQK